MKVLSIKQPFAELIVSGRKKIELRKWNTKFRGEFLIHASQNADKKAMEKFGFNQLPLGCIVGKAVLVNVKKYANKEEFDNDNNLHLADNSFGNYGFQLENATRISPIIKAKGKLNFWNFDLQELICT